MFPTDSASTGRKRVPLGFPGLCSYYKKLLVYVDHNEVNLRKQELKLIYGVSFSQQHTVVNQGASNCYGKHIQAYYQGVIPSSNITCPEQYTPFLNSPF